MDFVTQVVAYVLLGLGALVVAWNFYLSWVRWPIHRIRLGKSVPYQFVSGLPLIGTGLCVGALLLGQSKESFPVLLTWVVIALDTGGPHWFIISMVVEGFREVRNHEKERDGSA